MALTRRALAAMGIEADKIDQIIEMHTETVDGLKKKLVEAQAEAEKVPELEKHVAELAALPTDDWQTKYDDEHRAFEEYRAEVARERETEQKKRLYRSLLRDAGIDEKRIDSIVKVTEMDDISILDGKLEDAEALADRAKAEWSDFIIKTKVEGAQVDDPPANSANAFETLSLADKMRYANENPADPAVKAWLGK